MNDAASAFAGVGFHCYSGAVWQQDAFHSAYLNKDILFTECSGVYGSDWWSNLKWYMDNIFIGSIEHNSRSGLPALTASSKATIPRDAGGPSGKHIGVSVGRSQSWALRITAFVTGRSNANDWLRYSLVVLNW
ncbi:hypothetical protein C2E23DRAFT_730867 [Lenzites betulinus]|nr:hypothetical protein C2E23DRAFT_730867 [Lenzites betulinus]